MPLVFIILVVALDSVGERKDDCASKDEKPFKKEENKSPEPSPLVSVDRSWKKEEEPVLCGEEWAKKQKAREIDFKYVVGLYGKKLPPSKKPSGELINRLEGLSWVNDFRNIWGGGLGWGGAKATERKNRWEEALRLHNDNFNGGNDGCLIELDFNPIGLIPHPYIPPFWSMQSTQYSSALEQFKNYENGDERAFEIAKNWGKENSKAINLILDQIFHDFSLKHGSLIKNCESRGSLRLYLAIQIERANDSILTVEKKWVSQEKLFQVILEVYPDAIAEYSPDWLKNQRIDVFIPQLNIAFEYQGQQHYEPIDFFGGEEAYKKTVDRDLRKQHLCEENDVKLIYWKYSEEITKSALNKKIQAASLR
ncbi:hypothetical protein OAA12_00870 [Akkermansiaceae bacterium]|nr:hypothetical protein [Akkermansiaceae bacterium]